jgi:hypothetical protein
MEALFPEGVRDQSKLKEAYDLIERHIPKPGAFDRLLEATGQRDGREVGTIEELTRKNDLLRAKQLLKDAGADLDALDRLFSSSH